MIWFSANITDITTKNFVARDLSKQLHSDTLCGFTLVWKLANRTTLLKTSHPKRTLLPRRSKT